MNIFTDIEERNQAVGSAEGYSDVKTSTQPRSFREERSKKSRDFRRNVRKAKSLPVVKDPSCPYAHVERHFEYIEPTLRNDGQGAFDPCNLKPQPDQLQAIIDTLQQLAKVSMRKLFLGETVVFDYCLFMRIQQIMIAQAKTEQAVEDEPWGVKVGFWIAHAEKLIALWLQLPECFDRDVSFMVLNMLDSDLRWKWRELMESGAAIGFRELERFSGLDRLVHAGTVGWGNALDSHGGNQIYRNLHYQIWKEFEAVRNPGGVVKNETNTSSSLPAVKPDVGTLVGEVGKDESK